MKTSELVMLNIIEALSVVINRSAIFDTKGDFD